MRRRCRFAGETFVEVAGVSNDFRRAAGDQQFTRISGHAGRASADFVCITDFFDLHDQINLILSDACRVMRIRQQLLRQHHDLLRAVGIHHRVAQRTATGFAGITVSITEFIAGGHAKKRNINIEFAALYQMHTTAVE